MKPLIHNQWQCWQCKRPFEAVKYIEQNTRGVSPCCDAAFRKINHEVIRVDKEKTTKCCDCGEPISNDDYICYNCAWDLSH